MKPSINNNLRGFTIVELLIVIVVIGILAAITVVAYRGMQNKAHDAAIVSDLKQIATAMEIHRDDGPYEYPIQSAGIRALNLKLSHSSYDESRNNLAFCVQRSAFGIAAVSKSGVSFYVTNSSGGIKVYDGMTGSTGSTCDNMGLDSDDRWMTWGYTSSSGAWAMGLGRV